MWMSRIHEGENSRRERLFEPVTQMCWILQACRLESQCWKRNIFRAFLIMDGFALSAAAEYKDFLADFVRTICRIQATICSVQRRANQIARALGHDDLSPDERRAAHERFHLAATAVRRATRRLESARALFQEMVLERVSPADWQTRSGADRTSLN
jgi:hypothetical protein